MNHTEIES